MWGMAVVMCKSDELNGLGRSGVRGPGYGDHGPVVL